MVKTARPTEYDLFRIFQEECTEDAFREIIKTTMKQAKEGNHEARLFVTAYALGTPRTIDFSLSSFDLAERMQASNDGLLGAIYPEKRRK